MRILFVFFILIYLYENLLINSGAFREILKFGKSESGALHKTHRLITWLPFASAFNLRFLLLVAVISNFKYHLAVTVIRARILFFKMLCLMHIEMKLIFQDNRQVSDHLTLSFFFFFRGGGGGGEASGTKLKYCDFHYYFFI